MGMFGDISKIAGTTIHAGPLLGKILSQALAGFQNLPLDGILSGISKAMQGMNGAPTILAALKGNPSLASLAGGIRPEALGAAVTKAAYIAVLLSAIEAAKDKPHFNVETAINDLWTSLGKIRPTQNPSMAATISDLTGGMNAIAMSRGGGRPGLG